MVACNVHQTTFLIKQSQNKMHAYVIH